VDHREVRRRLVADAGEVVEDRLLAELLDQPAAGRAAGETGRDHGAAEQLQRARDVDALPAGGGAALDRAMALAEAEARDRHGAVDRRVEGDGEDHDCCPRRRILSSWCLILSSGVLGCRPRRRRITPTIRPTAIRTTTA